MFGLGLSIFILVFGIFLKTTTLDGFKDSKRFSIIFIILGIIGTIGKILLMYQKGEL
jgi:hypothetical protein